MHLQLAGVRTTDGPQLCDPHLDKQGKSSKNGIMATKPNGNKIQEICDDYFLLL